MKRHVVLSALLLVGSACNNPTQTTDASTQDGGSDAASNGLFANRYRPTTDLASTQSLTESLATVESAGDSDQWDTVETGTASGTAVNDLLSRLDSEFVGSGASSTYSATSTIRRGIMLGRAAMTDAERDVAHETVAKMLAVVRGLATVSELRSAAMHMTAGNATMARASWDRAAAYFASLDEVAREYQSQTVPNVWGPGRNAIATDNIVDTFVDLLVRGATAIDASDARTVIEIANEADVFLARLYVSMSAKYAASFEDATLARTEIDPGWRPEGTYALEGAILPYIGLMPDNAASSAPRTHWRMDPAMITRAQHLRDLGAIFALANAARLEAFTSANENERYATIARFRGTIGALKDALAAADRDSAALMTQVDSARTRVQMNDAAGALASLQMVQTAVTQMASGM